MLMKLVVCGTVYILQNFTNLISLEMVQSQKCGVPCEKWTTQMNYSNELLKSCSLIISQREVLPLFV